jgi:hypothetical protein
MAERLAGYEEQNIAGLKKSSRRARLLLEQVRPVPFESRVLEVGSGAHGLIFYFDAKFELASTP